MDRSAVVQAWYDFVKEAHEKIRKAAHSHTQLKITYESKGATSVRYVEPYKFKPIKDKNGKEDVILYAYCKSKNAIRTFKLENLKAIENTSLSFAPKWEIEIK